MPMRFFRSETIKTVLCTLLFAIFLSACATSRPKGERESSEEVLAIARDENTPDAKEYQRIDSLYRNKDFPEVLNRSKNFSRSFPNSQFLDMVYSLRALALLGQKQYQSAIAALKKVLETSERKELRNMTYYNIAFAHFELGQIDLAANSLDSTNPASLDLDNQIKFHILRSKISRLKHDNGAAARDILNAIEAARAGEKTAASYESMIAFFDDVVEPLQNSVFLERLYSDFESSPVVDRILFKLGHTYFSQGSRDRARPYFERITSQFPASKFYTQAQDYLRKLDFQGIVDPRRVGVLLPLSGRFARYGQSALHGIELAFDIFKRETHSTQKLTLVVMDDEGDVDRALAAMDELFYKHQVAVVIGPMISKLADPVGKKAQELGMPLISLTQKEAIGGDYVFNAALTPEMQVRAMAAFAVEKLKVKRFAIMAPDSKFGSEYAQAFWNELEGYDAVVRGYETYPDGETDYRRFVDRIVGLGENEARNREIEELNLLKEAVPIKGRSKKLDRMFSLKPIVDFEAVFIPDEPKALGQILPTFAYRDVENIIFLGINTWNSSELISRAGNFAENAMFVDGFYAGSENPITKRFIEEFRQTFGTEPGLLEALAFDAGRIIAYLMRSNLVASRKEMRDRIMSLRNFEGVSGNVSYRAGRLSKSLHILTVKSGRIEEVAQ